MRVHAVHKQAPDGWILRAQDVQPDGPPRALVVAGHAMMVDSRTLWQAKKPTLVGALVDAGFRVLVADLRGHGHSGPHADAGGQWTYDDLVADTAIWRDWADELAGDLPVIWLSHSLFGHTSMAWFGQNPARLPGAFVALAVNAWNHRFEPHAPVWWLKSAMMRTSRTIARAHGKLPVKALRLGNHDESKGYWMDLTRMAATSWSSRSGVDYHAGLARIACPVLCVWSEGDRVFTRPADGKAFTAPLPQREILVAGSGCTDSRLRGLAPGHMELVTSPRSAPIWQAVVEWCAYKTGKTRQDGR